MKHSWDIVVVLLSCAVYCLCASIGVDEGKSSVFDDAPYKDNYQSWNDWLAKRSLGDYPEKYQQWRDWAYDKRNFGTPSNNFDRLDNGHFQKWSDWIVKRGFQTPIDTFGSGANFQNWADFNKRQGFQFPYSDMPGIGANHFQSWQDWVKRMGSSAAKAFGGNQFGKSNPRFMNWRDMYKRSADKRELDLEPARFGNSRRFFTDRLQDWRSTFKGVKRSAENKEQKEE